MKKRVLIVDGDQANRDQLDGILREEYATLGADCGADAIDILRTQGFSLSAVFVDIGAPDTDGYDILKRIREDARNASIPVIAVAGKDVEDIDGAESEALLLGANDFIRRPLRADIIRFRLRNGIALRETAAVENLMRVDELTGLYTRGAFFRKAAELIARREPGYYVMASFDIENFKVINDQYGNEKGDDVLRQIGLVFQENFEPIGGICCRITADNFAALYPRELMDTDKIEHIRSLASRPDSSIHPLTFSVGRYIVTDLSLPVSGMYDRAILANASVKGRFDANIALYDESMRTNLLREQEITGEMKSALETGQFEVWFQPQYNHATRALVGAEALVRWRHPEKGLIPPGDFVSVFERNGFIYEMDKFVWRKTCALLREWIDQGRSPLPVSVNISRYDMFRSDLIDVITGLVREYRLPVSLLRLEITESAFAKSADPIIRVVKKLIDYGFTMEIDDFGSGYSSLNTLKDVPAHILKLDMRFLESSDESKRGGSILESVVRMARWLGMSVIAEGVEMKEQADFLESVGCSYVQGYLYAKPMPVKQYEALAGSAAKEERMIELKTVETLDNSAFWDPESMDTLIFNSFVGGACIFEFHDGRAEPLRANRKYAQVLGGGDLTLEEALRISWHDHLSPESRPWVLETLQRAIDTDEETACEAEFIHLTPKRAWACFRVSFRVIARTGDRYLFYCVNEDITYRKQAEQTVRESDNQLRFLNDIAHELLVREDADAGINEVLRRVREYFGGNRAYIIEFDEGSGLSSNTYETCAPGVDSEMALLKDLPMTIAPFWLEAFSGAGYIRIEDVDALSGNREGERLLLQKQGIRSLLAVPLMKAGALIGFIGVDDPIRRQSHIRHLKAIGDYIVAMLARRDLNARVENERESLTSLMNDTPGGFARMRVLSDGSIVPVYANDGLCQLLDMTRERVMRSFCESEMWGVHPEDLTLVKAAVREMLDTGEVKGAKYRLRHGTGGYIRLTISGRTTRNDAGEVFLNMYYSDIPCEESPREGGASEYTESDALLSKQCLAKLCENYHAIYLLDTEREQILPLKMSREIGAITHGSAIVWNDEFEKRSADLIYPEYGPALLKILSKDEVRGEFRSLSEHREMIYLQKTNTWKKIAIQPMRIENGITLRALATVSDITETKRQADDIQRKRLAEERKAREYERLLFDSASEMYARVVKIDMDTDNVYILRFDNDTPVEIDMKQSWKAYFEAFVSTIHPDDRVKATEDALSGRLEEIPKGEKRRFTYRRRMPDGGYHWFTTTLRSSSGGEGDHNATMFTMDVEGSKAGRQRTATAFTVDINDEMIERARLKDLSEHDGLTDLFNPMKLEAMMETEYKELSSCGVLFFDVNYLKVTNDTQGHEAGNALLCQVADSIRSITSRNVHGYRYGGDEFLVVACGAKEKDLNPLLKMWKTRLNTLSAESGVHCSVAVGRAWGKAPLSVSALIHVADEDMYRNKTRMKAGG